MAWVWFVGIGLVLISPLFGVLIGAFCGFVVGLFFPDTFMMWRVYFGLQQFAPWQIGAFLGFVGGFFKATQTNKST